MRPFPEVVFAASWEVETGTGILGASPSLDWKRKKICIPPGPMEREIHRELLIRLRLGIKQEFPELAKKLSVSPMSLMAAVTYHTNLLHQDIFDEPAPEVTVYPVKSLLAALKNIQDIPPAYSYALALLDKHKGVVPPYAINPASLVGLHGEYGLDLDSLHATAALPNLHFLIDAMHKSVWHTIVCRPAETLPINRGLVNLAKTLDKLLLQTSEARVPSGEYIERLGTAGWGKVTWESAPMYVPAKFRTLLDHRRKIDAGCIPKHINRLLSDQKLFDIKRKRPGGTALLDTSGSMSLSAEDIDQFVMAAPGLTVAGYGGQGFDDGRMILYATKGKVVDRAYRRHVGEGNNLIDGPALKWLGKMPEPRIWVSDGQVTGTGESMNATLKAESKAICRYYKIRRIPSIPEALEVFKRKEGI